MTKNNKRGFNLIEIAIVLAVIGLVIGGIYVAASAVTENNRKQNTQKQLLTIVQNIRALYATQAAYVTPSTAAEQSQTFPADMQAVAATRNAALNSYGGQTTVVQSGAGNQQFTVTFGLISQGACVDILSKAFGSSTSVNQIGLVSAGIAGGTDLTAGGTTGVTPTAAAGVCTAGNTNNVAFGFNLRG